MQFRAGQRMGWIWGVVFSLCVLLERRLYAQALTLDAPDSVASGASVRVSWTGPSEKGDTLLIVKAGAPDNDSAPGHNAYTWGKSPISLTAPDSVGDYEIRLVSGKTRAVFARRKLVTTPVTATVSGAASVVGGGFALPQG